MGTNGQSRIPGGRRESEGGMIPNACESVLRKKINFLDKKK